MNQLARHRIAGLLVLTVMCAANAAGASKRTRTFNARFDAVWKAADRAARDAFLLDHSSREDGELRFRAGLFRGYRFEVGVVESEPGKTRVEMELRTDLRGIDKDAWRNADRYLELIAHRLRGPAK
jgi:hypothetical protein